MPSSNNRENRVWMWEKKNVISTRHSDQVRARGRQDVNHSDYMDLVLRSHAWCKLEGTRPQEAGGGGRRHLFMLLHCAATVGGGGVGMFHTRAGQLLWWHIYLWDWERHSREILVCLLVVLCLFSLSTLNLYRRDQILRVDPSESAIGLVY